MHPTQKVPPPLTLINVVILYMAYLGCSLIFATVSPPLLVSPTAFIKF